MHPAQTVKGFTNLRIAGLPVQIPEHRRGAPPVNNFITKVFLLLKHFLY